MSVLDLTPDDLRGYDFVWASPPCQRYSDMTRQSGDVESKPALVARTRLLLMRSGVAAWCIENVVNAPLINPILLCGAMFGLGVIRHRLFEMSWPVEAPEHTPHKGSLVTGEYVTVTGNGGVPAWTYKTREARGMPRYFPGEMSVERWQAAMGIDWMQRHELVEAIPPAFSRWIGERAMERAACVAS